MNKKISVLRTGLLAIHCHKGQKRKASNHLPYVYHPIKTAKIVRDILVRIDPKLLASRKGRVIIQASLLHDTLENTGLTYEQIRKKAGKATADLVRELTSEKEKVDKLRRLHKDREVGKAVYLAGKMNQMSSEALLIKLADRLHNLQDTVQNMPEFFDQCAKETRIIVKQIEPRIRKESRVHQALFEKIRALIS